MPRLNPITADCLFALRLDELNAADNALDASGNGRHFTRSSGYPTPVAGVFAGARDLVNGSFFYLADEPALRLDEFTVAGWLKPRTGQWWDNRSGGLIGKGHDGISGRDFSWMLNMGWNGGQLYHYITFHLLLTADGINFTELQARSSAPLPLNTWAHVVAAWDGTYATLWINGRPHAKIWNETGRPIWYDARALCIGRGATYVDMGYRAPVDDWSLYTTAKTDDWAYEQYNDAPRPAESTFIPYVPGRSRMIYLANELQSGEALRDATGNARHATAYAAPAPTTGWRNGARDLAANGQFFETWHAAADCPDVLTAIAVCKVPASTPSPSSGARVWHKIHTRGAGGLIGSSSWNLGFESDSVRKPQFGIRLSGGTLLARAAAAIDRERWYLLLGTFDGFFAKIYGGYLDVLGAPPLLLASVANTTGTTDILYSTEEFGVSATYEFRGCIDEVALMGPGAPGEVGYPWVADEAWVEALYYGLFSKAPGPKLSHLLFEYEPERGPHRIGTGRKLGGAPVATGNARGPKLGSLLFEFEPERRIWTLGTGRTLGAAPVATGNARGPQLSALVIEYEPDAGMHRIGEGRKLD